MGRTVGGPARIPAGSGTAPRPTTRGPAYAPPAAGAVRATAPGDGLILNSGGSQAVLGQVNAARNGMRGANHRPLPPGPVTVRENGRLTLDARTGRYEVRADGTLASYHANGQVALFLRDGRVRSLRTPEFELHRSPGGGRTLVGRRPDQSILVATGRSGGYLERSISIGKRPFIQRTYARNGATQTRFFRPYRYRGLFLPVYVPPVYYPAAFYRWIFGPWRLRPIYAWPWLNQLWYRFQMGYFTPAPYYSGADFWLADYVESQTLEAGYEEEPPLADETGDSLSGAPETVWLPEDDQLCADEDTPIGEELRAAIAEEVRNLIAAEEALSGGGEDPSRMDPRAEWRPNRLFIVSRRLEVLAGRRTCELSPGAVLQLIASPEESTAAMLRVVASKRGDCPVGVEAAVSLQDLQEMRNDLRARLDAGLEALRNGQGQAGLPPAPPAALAPPQPGTPGAPAAEPGVPALLADQQRQADRAESEIVKAALPAPPGRQ
ncbi:MAG: hypothetical protein LAQ30_12050 [Acidobacteriia bacterium]|nr:hypothetical protein [Terriglobia bacterium]